MNSHQRKSTVFIQYIIFAIILIHAINEAGGECNVCQSNQAACINSTSFYLCFGDKVPNMDELYHCKVGFDCTDLNAICVQSSSERRPSCGDTSLCGNCSAHRNHLFACMGRTAFQMCYGAIRPTGQIGYCPKGYLCDATSDAICTPENMINDVTCDVVDDGEFTTTEAGNGGDNSTPTLTPTPTPTSNPMTPQQVCEEKRLVGLYPTVPRDVFCKRYIHCYYLNGVMQGVVYNCSSRTYFHVQQQQCVFNKPSYCL